MKIAQSNLSQVSSHKKAEEYKETETLTYWKSGQRRETLQKSEEISKIDIVQLEASLEAGGNKINPQAAEVQSSRAVFEPVSEEEKAMADLNMRILKDLVERLTGRTIKLSDYSEFQINESTINELGAAQRVNASEVEQGSSGYGIIYRYDENYHESESMTFSTEGVVETEDGQEIEIAVNLNMSRSFVSHNSIDIRAGEALKDPLILNFDGKGAELTERNFSFDLDSDGQEDQISFVSPGNGFLAYDKNGDQQINNGSELFGAATGNGFGELAVYDQDKNGWIDENDSIYQNLRIWMKTDDSTQLIALGKAGVGAIYLGHVETPFQVKDEQNSLKGQVRSSGVFLQEDGAAGIVQQIDLVV